MTAHQPSGTRETPAPEMAIVMLSNFGRADGGRETWAYNFIPRFLERYPALRLRIYGFRVAGEPDNRETLLGCVAAEHRHRVSIEFIEGPRNRIPNAIYFINGLRRLLSMPLPQVRLVIAVGSFVELLAVLSCRGFRAAARAVWLRSIFAAEKVHRYPARLRRLLERQECSTLRRADLIIANGEDTAAAYRSFGLPVTVIANATDLERWTMPPSTLRLPIQVAYIGRLTKVKGILEFLEVARRFAQAGEQRLRFHVIGEGAEQPAVSAAADRGEIVNPGSIPNELLPEALREIDVCVALGFVGAHGGSGVSNALVEQMAAARVLVCWDNAAYRQVLDDRSCYFVPQGDLYALRQTLIAIAEAPEKAAAAARQAAAKSHDYDIDRHVDSFGACVEQWIGHQRRGEPRDVRL